MTEIGNLLGYIKPTLKIVTKYGIIGVIASHAFLDRILPYAFLVGVALASWYWWEEVRPFYAMLVTAIAAGLLVIAVLVVIGWVTVLVFDFSDELPKEEA